MNDPDRLLREYYTNEPPDIDARERLKTMIMAPRAITHRPAIVAGTAAAALVAVIFAVLWRGGHGHAPAADGTSPPPTSPLTSAPAPTPTSHGLLTDRQFAVAVAIAHHEADRAGTSGSPLTATASVGRGTVTDSNTGHRCTSGTLLHITLIGTFNVTIGGVFVPPGSTGQPANDSVHGVLITADPASGHECLLSVQTGQVTPDPAAVTLFTS